MAESEIPEDLRRAALAVFWKLADHHEATKASGAAFWSDEATPNIIAKALLAERERAAQIATGKADDARKLVRTFGETTCAGFCAGVADEIATAIRGQEVGNG